jgi:hypothetical protein
MIVRRWALALALLVPSPALAQTDASPAAKTEARERFDRGLSLFNDGDNAGALAEFRRAYDLIPNALVLYNIGLVYAQMGRPVEAVDALDKLLAAPGSLAEDKLTRAKRTRDDQAQRIAELSVVTSVPATIEVDNVAVGSAPLTAPLKISGGVHVVGAVAAGYVPSRKEVTVAGGQKAEVSLELAQMQGRAAHLTLRTHLPAADVFIDDQATGKTPLSQSITLAPGPHKIELRRAGYESARQDIALGEGATGEVTLEPEEDKSAVATAGGRLALDISESQGVLTVDGKPRGVYAGSIALAPGAHRLLVERGGFESLERDVNVDAGRTITVRAVLEPTPDTRAAYVSRTTSQRTWGIVATAGGLAIVGGAVGFLVWNSGQKSGAQNDLDAAEANVQNKVGVCNTASIQGDAQKCNQPVLDAQSRLNDANGRDVIGYIGAGVGGAVALLGAYLLVSNDSPHKYDRTEHDAANAWRPLAWWTVGGGGVGVAGGF